MSAKILYHVSGLPVEWSCTSDVTKYARLMSMDTSPIVSPV